MSTIVGRSSKAASPISIFLYLTTFDSYELFATFVSRLNALKLSYGNTSHHRKHPIEMFVFFERIARKSISLLLLGFDISVLYLSTKRDHFIVPFFTECINCLLGAS